ncbi:MAG: 5-formyltetrahydrofolate cyclo-ligase [Chamaesiphon sp.]|nr:5-formyltetrahydrofolate cyclo-ligase [Chamaesiphon sp.]
MSCDKTNLRRQFLQQRQELPAEVWRSQSDQICHQISTCPQFLAARTILAYQSHRQEPNLDYLFTHSHKQWGLPRSISKELLWQRWQPSQPLIIGKYGILEPDPRSAMLTPDLVDLILVPAVAMDNRGYRLGYGGGYYDRLRSDSQWRKIPTIGIVFDFNYVEQLPTEAWDLPLDAVCTELGFRL